MDRFDTVIIGAGVVGLAIAREIAGHNPFQAIVVLERNARCGQETSSRNSEVIHAGMYYPAGSLKARLCMEGNPLLYAYCRTHGIAHEQTGKLIVARDDAAGQDHQVPRVDAQVRVVHVRRPVQRGPRLGLAARAQHQHLRVVDALDVRRRDQVLGSYRLFTLEIPEASVLRIADPDLPAKAGAGRAEEITPCISCNRCCRWATAPKNMEPLSRTILICGHSGWPST